MDNQKTTLFLSNVSLPDETIVQILNECGDLHRWKRIIDPTGCPKQFGFAEFQRIEGASRALKLIPLASNEIRVRVDTEAAQMISRWQRQQREHCDREARRQQVERDEHSLKAIKSILEPAQERQQESIEEQIKIQEEAIREREQAIQKITLTMQSFDSDCEISDPEQDRAPDLRLKIPTLVLKPQSSSATKLSIRAWVRQQIQRILALQDSTLEDWIINSHISANLDKDQMYRELEGLFQDETSGFIDNLFTLFPPLLTAKAIED
jgi:hypothetical protein